MKGYTVIMFPTGVELGGAGSRYEPLPQDAARLRMAVFYTIGQRSGDGCHGRRSDRTVGVTPRTRDYWLLAGIAGLCRARGCPRGVCAPSGGNSRRPRGMEGRRVRTVISAKL